MAIILFPFLLMAFAVSVYALIKSIGLIWTKQIGIKELLFGLGISLGLFGVICIYYLIDGSAYIFGPAFLIPFFMVILPFIFYLSTMTSYFDVRRYISKLLLISTGITGILGIVFYYLLFGLGDFLGIDVYY